MTRARPAPRRIDRPQPGQYWGTLVRGGPVVPIEILHGPTLGPDGEEMDRSLNWCWLANGVLRGGPDPCPIEAGVMDLWTRVRPADDLAAWDAAVQRAADAYEAGGGTMHIAPARPVRSFDSSDLRRKL